SSEPNCGTGFECNVERCASRHVGAEVAQTLDLSVVVASSSMMSSCHYPIINDQYRADSGIGARLALGFFGFFLRLAHEPLIPLCHRRHGQMDNCDRPLRQLPSHAGIGQDMWLFPFLARLGSAHLPSAEVPEYSHSLG